MPSGRVLEPVAPEREETRVPSPVVQRALLEIDVLGPVRVRRDGSELRVGGPVDRALLGILAASAPEPVAVAHLLEAAYPGVPQLSAKRALQTAVWRLRRALGGDGTRLVTDQGGYRLDVDPAAVDAGALRLALNAAMRASRGGRPADAIAALSKATAPWRGPAPELPAAVTDPLEELVGEAIEGLATLLLGADRPEDALPHLQRFLDVHPDHRRSKQLAEEAVERRRLSTTRSVEPSATTVDGVLATGPKGATTRSPTDAPIPGHLTETAATVLRLVAVTGGCTVGELHSAIEAWTTLESGAELVERAPDLRRIVDIVADAAAAGLLTETNDLTAPVAARSPEIAGRLVDVARSSILTLHTAAAQALGQLHGPGPGPHLIRIARHSAQGMPLVSATEAVDAHADAVDYILKTTSETEGDPEAALDLVERAREIHQNWIAADTERYLALALLLGRVRDRRGDAQAADEAWEEVAQLAITHDHPQYLARAALELAGTIWNPRPYAASEVLELALQRLPPEDGLTSLIVLRRVQLERHAPDDTWPSRVSAAGDRLWLAGVSNEDLASHATLGLTAWISGVEVGAATLDDDPELEALVSSVEGAPMLMLRWKRWGVSRAIAQGRLSVAERRLRDLATRMPSLRAEATTNLEADELAAAPLTSALQLSTVRVFQGRLAEADAISPTTVSADTATVRPTTHVDGRALTALFLSRSGHAAEASSVLSAVLGDLTEQPPGQARFLTAINAAYVAADLAEPEPVRHLLDELDGHRGRHGVIGPAGYCGVTEHALGRLRLAVGDPDGADEMLAAAAAAHVRVGAHLYSNLSRFWRAVALQQLGGTTREAEAQELLSEVERAQVRFRSQPLT